jgi:hypothetical protein
MTDIFQRLAARAQGEERQLRPQVQGLFEPQGRDDDGFVEVTEERLSPAPHREGAANRTAPTERQGEVPEARHPCAPSPVTEDAAAKAADTPTQRSTPGPADASAPSQDSVTPPTAAPGPTPAPAPQRRDEAPPPPARTTWPHSQSARPAQRRPGDSAEPTAAMQPVERTRYQSEPEHGETPRPAPAAAPDDGVSTTTTPKAPGQPFATFRQPPDATQRTPGIWQPQAGRQVHIHIDHIEVRQQTRPAAEPTKPRRNVNPAPDLNDYLRRRRS